MGTRINFPEIAARKKISLPADWDFYKWERVGPDAVVLTASAFKVGPRTGKKKWFGPSTRVAVTFAEIAAEEKAFEAETGKCYKCGGDGEEWAGWNHKTGHYFRPCSRCGATGNAKIDEGDNA